MNVTRKDLDNEILQKLDRLDGVVNSGSDSDGFISYSQEKGFYFKKTNDSLLRRVISEDEIISLKNAIFKPNLLNEFSTYRTYAITNDNYNYATQKMAHNALDNLILNIDSISPSSIHKYINKKYYAYFKLTGEFVVADMYNNFNIIYHNQILKTIQEQFNLSKDIKIYDIVDFVFETNDILILATDYFGTYKYNLKTDEVEVLFNAESRIRKIELTHTNQIFVACDDFCAIYSLEGDLIEKFYNVKEACQIPDQIFKTSTDIFVLGKATGINQLDNLLHGWTLDEAEVGYNCIDKNIMPNPSDNFNRIFSTQLTEDYLFLYVKYYDDVYVWEYDLDTLELSVFQITDEAKDVLDIVFIGASFIVSKGNTLEVLNTKSSYKLGSNAHLEDLIPYENGILGFTPSHSTAIAYEIKELTRHIEDINFELSIPETSNNIDILVAEGANLPTKFYNKEGKLLQPTFIAKYNNDSIYKFMNCPEKTFIINIHVDENTVLDGIIIRSNKMFLR